MLYFMNQNINRKSLSLKLPASICKNFPYTFIYFIILLIVFLPKDLWFKIQEHHWSAHWADEQVVQARSVHLIIIQIPIVQFQVFIVLRIVNIFVNVHITFHLRWNPTASPNNSNYSRKSSTYRILYHFMYRATMSLIAMKTS